MIDYKRLTPLVERAAGIAARNFPDHHDVADVKQELWVWVMEKRSFVTEKLAQEDGDKALTNIMVKVGQSYLRGEDAASYCYAEEDQFYYSVNLIKGILEVVFKHEDWISFAQNFDAMPKSRQDPSHAGNNLASYSDVSAAVNALPDEHYNVILWRYKYSYTLEAIGAELGVTKQAAHSRLETAHKGIQAFLGGRPLEELRRPSGGPSRPSGGAAARARTERDYEG